MKNPIRECLSLKNACARAHCRLWVRETETDLSLTPNFREWVTGAGDDDAATFTTPYAPTMYFNGGVATFDPIGTSDWVAFYHGIGGASQVYKARFQVDGIYVDPAYVYVDDGVLPAVNTPEYPWPGAVEAIGIGVRRGNNIEFYHAANGGALAIGSSVDCTGVNLGGTGFYVNSGGGPSGRMATYQAGLFVYPNSSPPQEKIVEWFKFMRDSALRGAKVLHPEMLSYAY